MTGNAAAPSDRQPILDAASILLIDTARPQARLLMGLRQPSNVFLPNKWVFSGGRLEAGDADVAVAGDLEPGDAYALGERLLPAAVSPNLPRALALAAVRELFEETGHAIAIPRGAEVISSEGVWAHFQALGLSPSIAPLRFIARAITPPGRTRRYDTRFFVANRSDVIENAGPADEEFADLNWFTIDEARALDLPSITRRILADLESLLRSGPFAPGPVPFYYEEAGIYCRDLIARMPVLA